MKHINHFLGTLGELMLISTHGGWWKKDGSIPGKDSYLEYKTGMLQYQVNIRCMPYLCGYYLIPDNCHSYLFYSDQKVYSDLTNLPNENLLLPNTLKKQLNLPEIYSAHPPRKKKSFIQKFQASSRMDFQSRM